MTSLSHKDDYLETPEWILNIIEINTNKKIMIDGCANYENKVCPVYIPDDKYGGALNNEIPENQWNFYDGLCFINPPRSKNREFVNKAYDMWLKGKEFVMLLCWNDLGNKYGEKLLSHIKNGEIEANNLGKIIFNKNGIITQFPSRLTYFWAWFKI